MIKIDGRRYYTRVEAAKRLGNISPQRVSEIARGDRWETTHLGRNALYLKEDVDRTRERRRAQIAWARLGIASRWWGDPSLREDFSWVECPWCKESAYAPGEGRWVGQAACTECGFIQREKGESNVPD